MIRVKKKRHKKHTKLIICLVVIACLLVGMCGYGAALALSAKDVKAQAETSLSNVNGIQTAIAGQDFATAAKNASNLQSSAQAMDEELSSPVWNVAAMLPVVGSDVRRANHRLRSDGRIRERYRAADQQPFHHATVGLHRR